MNGFTAFREDGDEEDRPGNQKDERQEERAPPRERFQDREDRFQGDNREERRDDRWQSRGPPRDEGQDSRDPPSSGWRDREGGRDRRFDNRDIRLDKDEFSRLDKERSERVVPPAREERGGGGGGAWRRGGERESEDRWKRDDGPPRGGGRDDGPPRGGRDDGPPKGGRDDGFRREGGGGTCNVWFFIQLNIWVTQTVIYRACTVVYQNNTVSF